MEPRDSIDPSSLSGNPAAFDPYNTNSFDDVVFTTDTLALDGADSPLFPIADWDQENQTYDGGLYSTPLNWEAPIETKVEPIPPTSFTTMNTLTSAQQEKLRNIAMPPHLQYRGQHSPNSTASNKSRSISSPENHDGEERSRKRKSSAEADDDDDDDSNPPVKKTAHNMIEKRYRNNLNDKIAALRDSVPSLRIMNKTRNGDGADDQEDLQGLTPAHKSNKATVLSKATEYIHHLEKRNKRLLDENSEQKARLAAFETLFRSGSMGYTAAPPMPNPFQFNDYNTPGPSPGGIEPQGMIQVPDDIRRLQGHMNQQPFSVPQEQYQSTRPMVQNGWQNSPYFGKLMVGSLAGLMLFEGMRETEKQDDTPGARGLFSIPLQLVRPFFHAVNSMEFHVAGYHVPMATAFSYLRIVAILGIILYAFVPSLFVSKPKPNNAKTQTASASIAAAPSLASEIQVRRQAWLTAIQTVWVPRHNFFLEAAALCLKIVKLSMRNIIGAQAYAALTGVTEQQEAARVKAWTIALDAQLAGGDAEVSKSRLTLTLLASGTLPDTPARLMLKALHIRVLLWDLGNASLSTYYIVQFLAANLARWQWKKARNLYQSMSSSKDKSEELPAHLAALLAQDCDDVLVDSIVQRAYNLAWDLATTNDTGDSSDGMDSVVNDHAIRSPLDAIAAWYSSLLLQRTLVKSFSPQDNSDVKSTTKSTIEADLSLAIRTAPTGSAVQARALVAHAVLIQNSRRIIIDNSVAALTPLEERGSKKPANLVNTSVSKTNLSDIRMSLRCAMAISSIAKYPSPQSEEGLKNIALVRSNHMSLLGFTAAFRLMESINDHDKVAVAYTDDLEGLAGKLRTWIGGNGEQRFLDMNVKHAVVARCVSIQKRIIGMEDAGYESMSDDGDDSC